MGIKGLIKQMLTEHENKRYGRCLSGRRTGYEAWLRAQEKVWTRELPKADETADNDFVLFFVSEGAPAFYTRKNIARYFAENPETVIVYGDEDIQNAEGVARQPWFKPDWSPDFFDSCFYFGSLVAVRRSWWEQRLPGLTEEVSEVAGSCAVKNLSVYERLIRELTEGAYIRGSRLVGHIPQILFHAESTKLQEHFLRKQEKQPEAKSTHETRQPVSVIIPSKDQPDVLRECIEGIIRCSGGCPCEILVVDNGSSRENRERAEKLLREVGDKTVSCRYIYEPMTFNFSRMCNLGAEAAKGELLLFLNDDVTLKLPGSITEMAALAERDYTGAVGMKLLYPDSGRIQHAGITNLPMGPVHKLQFCADGEPYYGRANCCRRNVLAVTAACLMVKKTRFKEAGGFPEELRVAFNDVALCFRLHELGYFNVCLNDRYAFHHESLSRGADESAEKLLRLLEERGRLYERHPALEGADPYYSEHLSCRGLDTRIAPAYVTAKNRVQEEEKGLKKMRLRGCREDACLMLRIEDFREREMTGYGVVLGDNNACYEKSILLKAADGAVYGVSTDGQYRPDLEENLGDQRNVALSGFWLRLGREAVPAGSYRAGMLARNRVTGLKLLTWSNRYLEL